MIIYKNPTNYGKKDKIEWQKESIYLLKYWACICIIGILLRINVIIILTITLLKYS